MAEQDTKCKICNSCVLDDVEQLLLMGTSMQKIVDYLKHYNICVSKRTVQTHVEKHSTRYRTIKQTRLLAHKGRNDKREKKEISMVSTVEMLDTIIDEVAFKLDMKIINPSIQEALKAAELKSRIKEGNPFKDSLLALFSSMSVTHGITTAEEPKEIESLVQEPATTETIGA